MKKVLYAVYLSSLLAILPTTSFAATTSCGKVTIADMNWNSATLFAHLDQFILNHGFGCKAELVPGDTMPTGTSMVERGEPDIAPEIWMNALKKTINQGIAEKRLRHAGRSLSDGGEEGFWVPKYMVDKYPELATIAGIKKHAKLFKHPEDRSLSAFYGCPAGWNCQTTGTNLFRALELKQAGFDLIDPGSGAGLAGAIAKAYERKQAWFGYYWAPTAILGKYEMVKVQLSDSIDKQHYIDCITQEECQSPKATMYPAADVFTITSESFASRSPQAFDYLTKRSLTNKQLNQILAWMEENQADGESVMLYFLEKYPEVWSQWVPKQNIQTIKSAVKNY
ncbi:ABC transporter substrate-binding protein [Pelagibaculum spongiae]|uniref:ABC transporter substrate-binding protein n=1 Tax=Pelagibaculum spongiae TaxID=2080658 RepID=A0A2V1H3X3_9GAMM|nr:ABC transporter substrate-binding protein [Pelagibaculum spongiae]PVZ70346.1 ABC transporter substrate-binding protein [Pelagibaculum spongiae]